MSYTNRYAYTLLLMCWGLWFWNFSYSSMLAGLLPAIRSSLNLSYGSLGMIMGAFFLGRSLASYPSARIAPKVGRKNIICIGSSLSIISIFLLSTSSSYTIILILTILSGFGLGSYLPQAVYLISERFPSDKRGIVFGLHDSATQIGSAAGLLLVGATLIQLGWGGVLRYWLILFILILLTFTLFAKDTRKSSTLKPSKMENSFPVVGYFLIVFSTVGIVTVSRGLFYLMPLYMTQIYDIDAPWAATLVGTANFLGPLGMMISGFLSDRIGRFKVLLTIMCISSTSSVIMAFANYGYIFIAGLYTFAFITIAYFPVSLALISDHTSPSQRSSVLGAVISISSFLTFPAPGLVGHLADNYGFKIAFLYPIIMIVGGTVALLYLRRRLP